MSDTLPDLNILADEIQRAIEADAYPYGHTASRVADESRKLAIAYLVGRRLEERQ